MKIASWNVNSIRVRIGQVSQWLEAAAPDLLLLQEIKCEDAAFPAMEFRALGYTPYVFGQKSYNGVAILSRLPASDIVTGLAGDPEDLQARYIEGTFGGVRVASVYLPNGNPVGTDKYSYKLSWMNRLKAHIQAMLEKETPFVLGGDFNVIPAEADVYDPKLWAGDALFLPQTRAAWRSILHLGVTEAFRALHPDEKEAYSFWDYQAGSWPKNQGLRIDHFLLSPQMADRMTGCHIDREPRAAEKASDHTPVILTVSDVGR